MMISWHSGPFKWDSEQITKGGLNMEIRVIGDKQVIYYKPVY